MKKNVFAFEAELLANEAVGTRYHRLVLRAPEIAGSARPGQFVNLRVSRTLEPLLARPFGIFWSDAESGEIELLFKPVGRGTHLLKSVPAGEKLPISGPLGNAFRVDSEAEVHLCVGGGTGMAPVYYLASQIAAEGKDACLVFGFRDGSYQLPVEIMRRSGASWRLASDAGEEGCHRGTAIDLLEMVLDGDYAGRKVALYVAGPGIMMKLAAGIARLRELYCEVSLEARMACGLGVCRGCVVRCFDSNGQPVNRTACTYGPVFRSAEVDWDNYLGMD
jgi:dihydroorotate dehydrogenase electron transfer subunit